jgi:hypothetical protein
VGFGDGWQAASPPSEKGGLRSTRIGVRPERRPVIAIFGIPHQRYQLRRACAILGLLIAVGLVGACGADEEREGTGTAPIGGDKTPAGESPTSGGTGGDGPSASPSLPEVSPGPPRTETDGVTPTDINPKVAPDER